MKRAQTASMIQVNSKISHLLLHTFCDLLISTSIITLANYIAAIYYADFLVTSRMQQLAKSM